MNDEPLSDCCGMPALDEIAEDGFAMCSGCRDHAYFLEEDEIAGRNDPLNRVEAENERNFRQNVADGICQPHSFFDQLASNDSIERSFAEQLQDSGDKLK